MTRTLIARIVLAAVLAAGGCKKKDEGTPAPAQGSGSQGVAPTTPPPFLPAKLAEKQGVVLAETPGGDVMAQVADGKPAVPVKDGTLVDVAGEDEADMSGGEESTVDIVVGGQTLTVSADVVVREGNLVRSSDGSFAVFQVIVGCGDLCHTLIHVIAADGRRKKLGDGVVDLVVEWREDGKELAVGSGMMWIVSLPDLGVREVTDYTAPAYAPDGTLYVRDHDGSAFILAATGAAKRVWKAKPKPEVEGDYGADDPPPVTFDATGKPKLELRTD